jgi:hypothetical protein
MKCIFCLHVYLFKKKLYLAADDGPVMDGNM